MSGPRPVAAADRMTPNHASPLLSCRGLTKRFGGGPLACDRVDLDLFAGRIHVLLGENGAGKSTLMSMLSGWVRPDAGTLFLDETPFFPRSPALAARKGIGMVHQRFSLIEALSGAENLALAAGRALSPRAASDLARRIGLPLDPRKRVAELSMGERQRLEILKLLSRDARILILDEPTSVLAPMEIGGLYDALRRLADQGRAVALITHKLSEIAEVADEVSVMRHGRMAARNLTRRGGASGEWDTAELLRHMAGREVPGVSAKRAGAPKTAPGEIVLRAHALCGPDGPAAGAGVNLEVARGEVLAIVGVAGNGQGALAAMLGGMARPARGELSVLGRRPDRELVAYVPEDRHGTATVASMTLSENMLLTAAGRRGAVFSRKAGARAAEQAIDSLRVAASGADCLARELSGGNLQKFILARELSKSAPLLVMEQPTQGLDALSVSEVHAAILRAARTAAVVLVTGDPAEALSLADRVAVIFKGRIVGMLGSDEPDALDRIGRLMAGLVPERHAGAGRAGKEG